MDIQAHPEYADEQGKLQTTLVYVHSELEDKTPPLIYGGNKPTQRSLRQHALEQLDVLKRIAQEPYFGRVDLREDTQSEAFYIGKHALPKHNIYSWADTLAAELYYNLGSTRTHGKLLLKRTLGISSDELTDIRDEFIDPSIADRLANLPDRFSDSLLLQLLRENRRGALHDIVATIQAQQYRLISARPDQLLVVQGVPGSGKTSIALHRLAYLLYQHKANLRSINMLVLGPNPMFLNYIANILPALGERKIPHRTFDAWILEQLGTHVEYEPQELSLELLLDDATPTADKVMQYRNARTKGSLQMAQLLDRYVAILHEDVLAERGPLLIESAARKGSSRREQATRTLAQITAEMERVRNLPFNQRRDALEDRLVRDISGDLFVKLGAGLRRNEADQAYIAQQVILQVHAYFEGWNASNVSVAYRKLLRTPELLRRAGVGIFNIWDLELLTQDAPTQQTPFRFSDLAALLYLKLRLDGRSSDVYDHIVIDEAQDITPLHFRVLFEYSRESSMTVLGDLSQSIYSHHGIAAWQELVAPTGGEIQIEHIQQSYRSTDAIVSFGNQLLRRIGVRDEQLAQHIGRAGSPVGLHSHALDDDDSYYSQLVALVAQHRTDGRASIALICRTATASRALAHALRTHGLEDNELQLVDSRTAIYRGGAVIMPAYLTKGMEFDSVIIADASATSYAADDLNTRLLYVAITRASHTLDICWQGQQTPLLDLTIEQLVRQPLFHGQLEHRPVTITQYAAANPQQSIDWIVERLAASDRLSLLHNGVIDAIVLSILVRTGPTSGSSPDTDLIITQLDSADRVELRERMTVLERAGEHQDALALTQLIYGLMRHHIQAIGLTQLSEGDTDVTGEVAVLIPLARAVREQAVTLSAGRWTTADRALQTVEPRRQPSARAVLTTLLNFGVVEQQRQGTRSQIRVPQSWITSLLGLALGYAPQDWDTDLLAQLPLLPTPIDSSNSVSGRMEII